MSLVTVQRKDAASANELSSSSLTSSSSTSSSKCQDNNNSSSVQSLNSLIEHDNENTNNKNTIKKVTSINEKNTSNFKDLKAIYNSSNSNLNSASNITSMTIPPPPKFKYNMNLTFKNSENTTSNKTSSLGLSYRKTIPRNKTSAMNESDLTNINMGYKNFSKRASLNLIDIPTESIHSNCKNNSTTNTRQSEMNKSKIEKNSLCIRLKSDEESTSNNVSIALESDQFFQTSKNLPTSQNQNIKHLPSKSNSFSSSKSPKMVTTPSISKKPSIKSSNNSSNSSLNIIEEMYDQNLQHQQNFTHRNKNLIEKYFVVKDAALILPRRSSSTSLSKLTNINLLDGTNNHTLKSNSAEISVPSNTINKYLPFNSTTSTKKEQNLATSLSSTPVESLETVEDAEAKNFLSTGDILIHLQYMISLLRPNDTIILAVKLCSYMQERIRYLVIVETAGSSNENLCEEGAILGFDLVSTSSSSEKNDKADMKSVQAIPPVSPQFLCTIGLVSPIYANCEISLDGDGGFKFKSHHSTHIFKPVSIQAMWSAYQYLHKSLENARKYNHYTMAASPTVSSLDLLSQQQNIASSCFSTNNNTNSLTNHEWIKYYSSLIVKNKAEHQFINEWYQKEERSAQREDFTTPYFDCLQLCKEQEETGIKIKEKLREIMISSKDDYGSMSSVAIREILEKELGLKLDNFKKFVDATIFQFYNQLVECATQILPYLYLGTEWNASNFDSLQSDKVTHILNISSEVDNFFPDAFKYLNIRVLDVEETDLLKEFDRTNKFIQEAKEQGTSCLVHCKMGVSRSASVVLAYLMKEFNWNYEQAFQFTKQKRNCINPNDSFKQQLSTYESILNAHRAKYNLFEPHNAEALSQNNNSPTASAFLPAIKLSPNEANEFSGSSISVKEAIIKIKSSMDQSNMATNNSSVSPNQSRHQCLSSEDGHLLSTSPIFKENCFQFINTDSNVSLNSASSNVASTNTVSNKPNSSSMQTFLQLQKKNENSINNISSQDLNQKDPSSPLDSNLNENDLGKNKVSIFFSISPPSPSTQLNVMAAINENSNTSVVNRRNNLINSHSTFNNFHQRSKSEQFFNHTIQSNNLLFGCNENQSCTNVNSRIKSLIETNSKSNDENESSFLLPIGTVKRQVESINFKNKSTSQFNEIQNNSNILIENSFQNGEKNCNFISESDIEAKSLNDHRRISTKQSDFIIEDIFQIDSTNNVTQQKNRSPDSKRFKWELFKKNGHINNNQDCLLTEFNRTKKIFEELKDKESSINNTERKLPLSLSCKSLTGETKKTFKSSLSST